MLITDKLDFWKKRLLDLGRRNRLINCPLPSDGKRVQRHSLLLKIPSSNELWKLLVEDDSELSFPLPIDKESEFVSEVDDLFSLSIEAENTLVKTYQTQNDTIKTLRNLMKKSREFSEEKGLNALHLAFGFLNWKEAGNIGQEMRSPLLLLPVKLTQEDLFSAIVLSKSDEEITSNQSLELKLLNDFNVVLPSISEETNLIDYLNSVSHRVKGFGWSVSYDVTQLSLFSFTKINMYRDLERNSEKICGHQIIRGINGEVVCDSTNIFDLTGYDHDSTEPGEVFSVVDADSSQQDAILLAKNGASFVLQGPPGTGKSQTITNIIAELIADGKKVLFVSEKMAALEVVFKRLTQVGLGNFCLTLHSHNAKRREILDQFEKSIKMSRSKIEVQKDAYNKLFRLKETRSALNLYNTELHTVIMPLGKTIFQVNGFLAQHENYRNIDFVQNDTGKFTPELLSQCESALEEVTRIVAKSGYQNNNPWNGSILSHTPTFEFRQRFLVDATKLLAQIEEGLNILAETNVILDNQNYDWSFGDIAEIKEIYNLVNLIPMTNIEWLPLDLHLALSSLDGCEVYIKNIKSLENEHFLMSSQYERMMSALQSERLLPVQEFNNTEICNLIETYNSLLELKHTLIEDRLNCSEYRDKLERTFSTYEKAFNEEQEINNKALSEWQKAQSILFECFAESVLLIDFESLLTRYRTNYRSWTRKLSISYYRDRKSILQRS